MNKTDEKKRKNVMMIKPVPYYGTLVRLLEEVYTNTELSRNLREEIAAVLQEYGALTT